MSVFVVMKNHVSILGVKCNVTYVIYRIFHKIKEFILRKIMYVTYLAHVMYACLIYVTLHKFDRRLMDLCNIDIILIRLL